ncbi:hypothetical protein SAMN05216474_1667 [Lishizhenia tianjinensis]|uniref:Uncharacterized protein n=1 Tax=Lishizhenia tianjinensis TaxID=477690 RepID=A0A1I6ZW59_9FLAO|nr:hypothetical protein [Lishizhenia tianjinensis]SFT66923.1 hypothetical protein SAMN05216474_1667 [Lishizhenia tianjinensis]
MKQIFFAVLTLGITLVSCKDQEIEKHLSTLDELETSVDEISARMDAIKDDSNGIMIAIVRNDLTNIQKHYTGPDTTNIALGTMLTNYKSVRKIIAGAAKNKQKIDKAIPEEREQLSKLRHDIAEGVNDREAYGQFVLTEKTNVAQLDTMSLLYERSINKSRNLYYTLKPKVDSLISTLEF